VLTDGTFDADLAYAQADNDKRVKQAAGL
jgi:hypothetical protein